ncbi:MAG: hypothetical protein ABI717_09805 [Actinomycetota bacterium]
MQPFDLQAAFRDAVLDLSEEPTPVNVRRYLVASRLLESAKSGAPRVAARPRRRRPEKESAR